MVENKQFFNCYISTKSTNKFTLLKNLTKMWPFLKTAKPKKSCFCKMFDGSQFKVQYKILNIEPGEKFSENMKIMDFSYRL